MEATFDDLNFDPSDQVILMIEPPQTEVFKKEFVEYLFESCNCAGLYFKNALALASFLHSKEFSMVIDIGGHNTYVSAISEGEIVSQCKIISVCSP